MDSEVLKHRAWLHRLALRLCGSHAGADDLVQDVIMRYLERFPDENGAPPDDPRRMKWLSTTLANSFKTSLRKKQVRENAALDPTLENSVTPEDPPEPDSYETITDEEFEQALKDLTERQRGVLVLSQQGRPHAEIGRELSIRVGTVAKRLFDARKRLRVALQRIIAARNKGNRTP